MPTTLTAPDRRAPTEVKRSVCLANGTEVEIRTMRPDDVELSLAFFQALSDEDRLYLRTDVTDPRLVARRIDEMSADRIERLVALEGGRIVADGALDLRGHGWGDNIGEIRLIVASDLQRLGLGSLLARELYHLAVQHRLDRIVARMMAPQTRARSMFRRLGFEEEFVIPEQVRDRRGQWQDLVIMRCNMEELWERMQDLFESSSHRWHR